MQLNLSCLYGGSDSEEDITQCILRTINRRLSDKRWRSASPFSRFSLLEPDVRVLSLALWQLNTSKSHVSGRNSIAPLSPGIRVHRPPPPSRTRLRGISFDMAVSHGQAINLAGWISLITMCLAVLMKVHCTSSPCSRVRC